MLTRTLDGEVVLTRTAGTTTAVATQNKIAGGWDFVVTDDWGRIICADSLKNLSAVYRAFKLVGV